MTPKPPHERLADLMDQRRGELGLSLREVAVEAGITPETLRAVRRGANDPSTLTRRGIERALNWSAGSIDRILEGGEPGKHASGTGTISMETTLSGSGTAHRDHRRLSDEEIINSGLKPETVEAILRMRRRIDRLAAVRDEDAIRRDDRVLGALHDEQDTA